MEKIVSAKRAISIEDQRIHKEDCERVVLASEGKGSPIQIIILVINWIRRKSWNIVYSSYKGFHGNHIEQNSISISDFLSDQERRTLCELHSGKFTSLCVRKFAQLEIYRELVNTKNPKISQRFGKIVISYKSIRNLINIFQDECWSSSSTVQRRQKLYCMIILTINMFRRAAVARGSAMPWLSFFAWHCAVTVWVRLRH